MCYQVLAWCEFGFSLFFLIGAITFPLDSFATYGCKQIQFHIQHTIPYIIKKQIARNVRNEIENYEEHLKNQNTICSRKTLVKQQFVLCCWDFYLL
jgi:hypothetical protein